MKEWLWQKFFMEFFAEQLLRNRAIARERGWREGWHDAKDIMRRAAERAV